MSEPYWSALGGSGAVDYKGAWAAGTQYQSGDVVRHNGIDYLAVNPSVGVDPGVATLASGELAYVERATDFAFTTTPADLLTLPALTFDGTTPIYIEFTGSPSIAANGGVGINLFDGSTDIGKLVGLYGPSMYASLFGRRRLTPSAGSHTYKVNIYGVTSGGTLYVTTGSFVPATLRAVRA